MPSKNAPKSKITVTLSANLVRANWGQSTIINDLLPLKSKKNTLTPNSASHFLSVNRKSKVSEQTGDPDPE